MPLRARASQRRRLQRALEHRLRRRSSRGRCASRSRSAPAAVAPQSVLGAGVSLTWSDVLLRTLYYLGLLCGAGAVVFGLLTRRLCSATPRCAAARPAALLLRCCWRSSAEAGSSTPRRSGTRYALVMKVGVGRRARRRRGGRARARRAAPSAGGGACALAAPARPHALRPRARPGQPRRALGRRRPRALTAAAVWLGGLLALVYVVPRATDERADAATGGGRGSRRRRWSRSSCSASPGSRAR